MSYLSHYYYYLLSSVFYKAEKCVVNPDHRLVKFALLLTKVLD